MANMVTIGGVAVDADDPCALYQALYATKIRLLAGEEIDETEIRSPVTHRRIKIARANIAALDKELALLKAACELKTTGNRTRYAKRIRWC
ncbi:hypothetical protein [Rhizobium leguminosarum]|uniref:hypothetical protein n=1 Tax=Rhizobium phage vB_RleM_PPF1 TaxID=1498228 RepID=UPI000499C5AB|nr:hypothetical protein [Rhizobium leguminosarum]YP_009099567.1 hypothetical protein PPF1_04 [Rhizobium phage vB_RleM_PPF1]AID18317.1 hypothetical protein PPF1_04 [Rhizobium phage vB_RleM_PPF1]MBY2911365.1 hypothetical protein [Rhizobium leguminosarum]